MREKTDKLDFIKMKNFHCVKDNVKRMKRQATDWEKIFAKHTSDLAAPQKAKHRSTV